MQVVAHRRAGIANFRKADPAVLSQVSFQVLRSVVPTGMAACGLRSPRNVNGSKRKA
jgi:hypothetical protein